MKRFFFSLIALSAAVVGCTQSAMLESPEIFNQEVSFSPYTGRTPVTKATDIVEKTGLASAGGFQVYCFLDKKNSSPLVTYIDDAHVTSNDGETWSYNKLVYWPDATSQSTLSFVAYSSNAVLGVDKVANTEDDPEFAITTVNGLASGFTFTVPTDVDNQVDLLATAYHKGHDLNNTSSGKVTLQFQHLLSRVGFKVQTTTDKSVTINALSFGGTLATSGTLDFDEHIINAGTNETAIPALSVGAPGQATYVLFAVDEPTATNKDDVTISDADQTAVQVTRANNSNYLMIMPQTVEAKGDIEINVEYTIGTSAKSKTATIELEKDFEFAAGRAYEFILNISTSSIKFTVTEDDWDNPTEDNESYPLIPEDENKVSAVAKVHSATTADIILTAKEAGLGKIGVEYKVKDDTDWTKINAQDYTAKTPKTFNLIDLDPNTEYVFRPYSEKDGVKTEYSEGSFITKTSVSVAINISGGVIDIQPYQATVYGECTNEGITERGFCLIQGSGTPTTNNRKIVVESGAEFKATFDGLTPAEQYTCCAYVIINGVTSYSDPANGQFWTAPVITVDPDTGGDNTGGDSTGGSDQKPDGPPVDSWEDGDEIPF